MDKKTLIKVIGYSFGCFLFLWLMANIVFSIGQSNADLENSLTDEALLQVDLNLKLEAKQAVWAIQEADLRRTEAEGVELRELLEESENKVESLLNPTATPTANAEGLGTWRITTYYTPTKDQSKYFYGTYDKDFEINCSGDCFVTANGYRLSDKDIGNVVACPSNFTFDTKLWIEDVGEVTCKDRGGAIKGQRLDLWVGSGKNGFSNIGQGSGYHEVFLLN